jgi:hypothetical protein
MRTLGHFEPAAHGRAQTSVGLFAFIAPEWGLFVLPARLWIGLCWVISRILRARLCIANFRSRLRGGDRFDDWVVGRQFVPDHLHHPVVVGLKLPPAYSHLLRQNGGFSHFLRVSGLVCVPKT